VSQGPSRLDDWSARPLSDEAEASGGDVVDLVWDGDAEIAHKVRPLTASGWAPRCTAR